METEQIRNRVSDDAIVHLDRILDMYSAPFARFIGLEIESVSLDKVECSLEMRPDFLNSMGRGHGAAIYGLIDHTFAIAANLVRDCTGQSSNVVFYRPASGKLRAVCVPVNRSRSLEIYDVRVYNEAKKLIASSTCTAFALPEARP